MKDSFSALSVAVLLLNYKGWRDTIACLESLFRMDHPTFLVLVCDNDSRDGSLDRIEDWALGRLKANVPDHAELAPLVTPPVSKPLSVYRLTRSEAENTAAGPLPDFQLLLIDNGDNRGFAAGNNVGLRCIMRRTTCKYAWVLNNDTIVRPDALSHLIRRAREKDHPGITGSTLLFFNPPDTAQAFGGAFYNTWTGRATIFGALSPASPPLDQRLIERGMNYVIGASMFVPRDFLEKVGLMSEDLFLYFEEIDWAVRGHKYGFSLAYAPESIVYHRDGATTGSYHPKEDPRRTLFDMHITRSRMIFHSKQGGLIRLLILPQFFLWFARALFRGHTYRARALVKALCSFRRWRRKNPRLT
ncbi:MAG: glycosyltransferase family 2 protein [Candidatus Riflebacteria bacterium]|nr:glycosyltransferase family 2 protein [Candidatus Riflebacteria bacterium]